MIDYEKLNIAHMLAVKLDYDGWFFDITFSENKICYRLVFKDEKAMVHDYYFVGIDDFITKLKELTQPDNSKPKYKDVWYLSNNHRTPMFTKAENQEGFIYCNETSHDALGKTVYPSREALIDAQIEYWKSLKVPKECQHESDGLIYCSNPPQNKCQKCGEFYK